jgi:D-alanyl-D-alanine carboxypeptidase
MGRDDELQPARRLDALLERAVTRTRHVRHGLLALSHRDGEWQWRGAHGVADAAGTPITTTTPYPIASVTKLFTAVVVMRLQERGALTISDRLVDHLPGEVTTGLHVRDGVDRTPDILLEHLLSHTSGLPDYYEDPGAGGVSLQDRLLAGEDVEVPFDRMLQLVREELPPRFAPQPQDAARRRAHYADTNYALLGAIIEMVIGEPLHEVFATELFDPLGLDQTSSYPHHPSAGPRTTAVTSVWAKDIELQTDGMLRSSTADGGIISTLDDQLRFLTALVRGEVFDRPDTFQQMQQRFDRIFFPIDYGLGLMRYAPSRWMSPLQRIPPVIGHTGSTATWLLYCSELDLCLAGTFDVAKPALPFRFVSRVLHSVQRGGSYSDHTDPHQSH